MTIAVNRNLRIPISFVFPQFTSFHSVSHSFHRLMNSINWPASSAWVFIAQLGEQCSANTEATCSNPFEGPKNFFSGYFRNCLNCDSLQWSHTHFICIPAVHIISFSESYKHRVKKNFPCHTGMFVFSEGSNNNNVTFPLISICRGI